MVIEVFEFSVVGEKTEDLTDRVKKNLLNESLKRCFENSRAKITSHSHDLIVKNRFSSNSKQKKTSHLFTFIISLAFTR